MLLVVYVRILCVVMVCFVSLGIGLCVRLKGVLLSNMVESFVVRAVIHIVGAVFIVVGLARVVCVIVILWLVGAALSLCGVVIIRSFLFAAVAVLLLVV